MKNTNTNKLALRAQSIRDLTAAELRVAHGGSDKKPANSRNPFTTAR
jgi:hypothetical protein